MPFSTPTQFAILGLVLVAGWLFGLASHPGGRKWKERYIAERDAHAADRKAADARIAQADRDAAARTAEVERRHAELERENSRLAKAAPVTHATISRPPARNAASPAYPRDRQRGWFDWNDRTTR